MNKKKNKKAKFSKKKYLIIVLIPLAIVLILAIVFYIRNVPKKWSYKVVDRSKGGNSELTCHKPYIDGKDRLIIYCYGQYELNFDARIGTRIFGYSELGNFSIEIPNKSIEFNDTPTNFYDVINSKIPLNGVHPQNLVISYYGLDWENYKEAGNYNLIETGNYFNIEFNLEW